MSKQIKNLEIDEDLAELFADELAELAEEFVGGDVKVFVENYASFKKLFEKEEQRVLALEKTGQSTLENHVPGPYECGLCGSDIRDDFPVSEDRHGEEIPLDVIRQRYACWDHVGWEHLFGYQPLCSYHQYQMEKDD